MPSIEEQLRDGFAEIRRLAWIFGEDAGDGDAFGGDGGGAAEAAAAVLEFRRERAVAKCVCIAQDFQCLLAAIPNAAADGAGSSSGGGDNVGDGGGGGTSVKRRRRRGTPPMEDVAAVVAACVAETDIRPLADALVDVCASAPPMVFVVYNLLTLLVLCDRRGERRTHRGVVLSGSSELLDKYLDVLNVELPARKTSFSGALACAKLVSVTAAVLSAALNGIAVAVAAAAATVGGSGEEGRGGGGDGGDDDDGGSGGVDEHLATLDAVLEFLTTLVDGLDAPERAVVFRNKRCCEVLERCATTEPAPSLVFRGGDGSDVNGSGGGSGGAGIGVGGGGEAALTAAELLRIQRRCRSRALHLVCRAVTDDLVPGMPAPCRSALSRLSRKVAAARGGGGSGGGGGGDNSPSPFSPVDVRMARQLGDTILFNS